MTTATDSDFHLAQSLRSLFIAARRDKRTRRENWLRNYRLVHNRSSASNTLPSWQPNPRSSEVYPICDNLVAWISDNDIVIDITPSADPSSDYYNYIAKICNDLSLTLYSIWTSLDYTGQVKLSAWDAVIYGTGILKSVWDNHFDDGLGNARVTRTDPFYFYPDPYATSLDDANYFVEARHMSLTEICRRWPEAEDLLRDDDPGPDAALDDRPTFNSESSQHAPINPGGQTGTFRWGIGSDKGDPAELQDRYPVYEYWVRDSENHWDVHVLCRDHVLLSEPVRDILPFDSHPYSRWSFSDIGEFWGISLVDHMSAPQLYLNRDLQALQMNAEMTGNPIFIEPANSGISRTTIPSRPGNRLSVNMAAMQAGGGPSWLNPPQMSQLVMDLVNFWIQRMENLSGMSAMTKGQSPPTQRSAQGTINTIQEAAFVRVRAAQRNLERCLESVARNTCDLIIQNYDEARIVNRAGPGAQTSALFLHPRHFQVPSAKGAEPLRYSLLVQAGSSAPTSRTARVAEADKLFTLGVIDDQADLEAHQYPNMMEILQRKAQKSAAGLHQAPGARQRAGRSS